MKTTKTMTKKARAETSLLVMVWPAAGDDISRTSVPVS